MIAQKALSGTAWAYAAFAASKLLTLTTTVVLARVLTPEDFGLIAAALIFVAILDAFRDFGLRDALVYTDQDVSLSADTCFWLTLGLGLGQALALYALAPLAQHIVDDEQLVPILKMLALVFIINAAGLTHEALLQKRLEFHRLYIADMGAALVKAFVAIFLLYNGYGIWSIIVAHLIGATTQTAFRWVSLDWRPRFRFSMDRARSLLHYGGHIFLVGSVGVVADRFDNFLIAILLDQRQLAFFFIASRLPQMLLHELSAVLSGVIFAIFSSARHHADFSEKYFCRTLKYSALVAVPIAAGLIIVAPLLVPTIFGEKWGESIILMQVLTAAALAICLTNCAGDALKAVGRPDIISRLTLFEISYSIPIVASSLYIFRDPLAAAWAVLFCNIVAGVIRALCASKILEFPISAFIPAFRTAFAGSAIMCASVYVWQALVRDLPAVWALASSIFIGVCIYAGVVWLLERATLRELAALIFGSRVRQ